MNHEVELLLVTTTTAMRKMTLTSLKKLYR